MNRWLKMVYALLVCWSLGGCAISFDKVPSCAEEATLDLVRSVIADSVLGTNEKPSAQRLRDLLRLTYPRATKLEENIKKYTCSADMVIEYDEGTHESEIIYESQLDDAGDHIVVVHSFEIPPELLIASLIRAATDDTADDNPRVPELNTSLPSHCQQGEHTVLDARFQSRGANYKLLSLCATSASPPFELISYRFGVPDGIELKVDATSNSKFNVFSVQTAPRVGEDIIYFTRDNYSYYVGIAAGMGSGITLRAFDGRNKVIDMFSGNDPDNDFRIGSAEIDFHEQVRFPSDVLRWARPPGFMLEESSVQGSEGSAEGNLDFPLSYRGLSATLIEIDGVDSANAVATGRIMQVNAVDYCTADPGGETGGTKLGISACVESLLNERGSEVYRISADCTRRSISTSHHGTFVYTGIHEDSDGPVYPWQDVSTGEPVGGGMVAGGSDIDAQFSLLCPSFKDW